MGIQKSLCYIHCSQLQILEKDLQNKYSLILKNEEEFWPLKLRLKWLSLGDRNTQFFSCRYLKRKKEKQNYYAPNSNGTWIENPLDIAREIRNNVISLFFVRVTTTSPHTQLLISLRRFSNNEKETLLPHLLLLKQKKLFGAFIILKLFGEDGLHAIFYQKTWDITKHHIINDIKKYFFQLGKFPLLGVKLPFALY